MSLIYIINANILRNLTTESFEKFKAVMGLCSGQGNSLVFFDQPMQPQNNNNSEPKKDLFARFVTKNKDISISIYPDLETALNETGKVQMSRVIVSDHPISNESEGHSRLKRVKFENLILSQSYEQLKNSLLKEDNNSKKKKVELLKKYGFVIAYFLGNERRLKLSNQFDSSASIVECLLTKEQWPLLVVALRYFTLELAGGFKLYFPMLNNLLSEQNDSYKNFLQVSKTRFLEASDILYDSLWDKIVFLSLNNDRFLKSVLTSEEVDQIQSKVDSLIEQGCQTAEKAGIQAELEFLARIQERAIVCSDGLKKRLSERVEHCFHKLVAAHKKKVKERKKQARFEGIETDLDTLGYNRNWQDAIEELARIPSENWQSLRALIDDKSAGLELKALLLSAPQIPMVDKKDKSIHTLAQLLAQKLLAASAVNRNVNEQIIYLNNAINVSVLSFVLGGGVNYFSVVDSSAKEQVKVAIREISPDSELDQLCSENPRSDVKIIRFLATIKEEPLPCKVATMTFINETYRGEFLVKLILKHYKLNNDNAEVSTALGHLLNSLYLVQQMGNAGEVLRNEYNRREKLAFVEKMEFSLNKTPLCNNARYSDFLMEQLHKLDEITGHKCELYRKSFSSFNFLKIGAKSDAQMRAELDALQVIRLSLIETVQNIPAENIDPDFADKLKFRIAEIAQEHADGFAKSGKGAVGVKPPKVHQFCNELMKATEALNETLRVPKKKIVRLE